MTQPLANPKEWTLLFYNAGSRDQSKMCGWSQVDLESVGSNDKVDLVCLSERSGWIGDRWGDNQGTRLYHLERNPEARIPTTGLGKLWQFLKSSPKKFFTRADPNYPKQTHLSDPAVLKASLRDVMQRYPARHYGLVVSGHGAAFGGQAVMYANGDYEYGKPTPRTFWSVQGGATAEAGPSAAPSAVPSAAPSAEPSAAPSAAATAP